MTRTVAKYTRVYVDGYDLSGYTRSVGPLELSYDEADLTTLTDTVKGYLRNHAQANVGTLNAVLDDTATTGSHAVMSVAGQKRTVLVTIGMNAAPAAGDPAFAGQFLQKDYTAADEGGAVIVSIPFSGWASDAASLLHGMPWGVLVSPATARTGANSGTGIDNPSAGATVKGGYMVYQVIAGNGTATVSIDDSANNSAFSALSGATTGSINCAVVRHGVIALSTSATVRRYLRWQVALGTATTVTFALAFSRNY